MRGTSSGASAAAGSSNATARSSGLLTPCCSCATSQEAMTALLERDSLFKRLRSKPENKVRGPTRSPPPLELPDPVEQPRRVWPRRAYRAHPASGSGPTRVACRLDAALTHVHAAPRFDMPIAPACPTSRSALTARAKTPPGRPCRMASSSASPARASIAAWVCTSAS